MAKGEIKAVIEGLFASMNEKRIAGEINNKDFRMMVCNSLIDQFPGMSLASAGTHYGIVKQKFEVEHPELVAGLGRAPDKRGGRPVGSKSKKVEGTEAAVVEVAAIEPVVEVAPEPETFTVRRAKDGVIVAEGLQRADADALIAKAAKAKKAKLELA